MGLILLVEPGYENMEWTLALELELALFWWVLLVEVSDLKQEIVPFQVLF